MVIHAVNGFFPHSTDQTMTLSSVFVLDLNFEFCHFYSEFLM